MPRTLCLVDKARCGGKLLIRVTLSKRYQTVLHLYLDHVSAVARLDCNVIIHSVIASGTSLDFACRDGTGVAATCRNCRATLVSSKDHQLPSTHEHYRSRRSQWYRPAHTEQLHSNRLGVPPPLCLSLLAQQAWRTSRALAQWRGSRGAPRARWLPRTITRCVNKLRDPAQRAGCGGLSICFRRYCHRPSVL
eukprot:SAG25_NODE_305_length_10124_cov_16.774464_17_plen_192_part_00